LGHNKVNSIKFKKGNIDYLDVVLLSSFSSQHHQGNTGGDATVTEKVLFLGERMTTCLKENEMMQMYQRKQSMAQL
jgi:hypothetical protein